MHTLSEIRQLVAASVDSIDWSGEPHGLYEPIDYVLRLGGKRLRPCLALMAADLYDAPLERVLPVARALEVFHNFTLLHDDVMDHAEVRRGQPTVHRRWNECTAILSGDAMSICAYRFLAEVDEAHLKPALDMFSRMAIEICEGQQYDMDFETRQDVSVDDYIEMIRLKTAVLLATALRLGAVIGRACVSDADALYDFGINIGLAFQLKDDYLDVYGDPATFGKAIGGDILCNKKTFMLISAMNLADDATAREIGGWLQTGDRPEQKIAAVTAVYNRLAIDKLCVERMQFYYDQAMECLSRLSVEPERLTELRRLAGMLMDRDH